VVGLLLPKQASQTFCVLDKGAPGGNFRFYMGCPANNTDPFNTGGCMLGAAAGDLAGINTLFEPTFGCDPTLPASECAFNPAAGAPNWPQCQSDPNIAHCPPIAPSDNFDISAVDGYTMLLRVDTQPRAGTHCNRLSTDASMLDLASCPTETNATLYSTDPIQQTHIDSTVSLLNQDDAALKARTRSTQTEAVYETPRGVRPRLKVAVKTQDPETGVMKFAITVHGAVISEPAKCADAPTTELATTFGLLVGSEHVLVGARLAWECHGSTLQTP
jgi:hypothetical protein